MAEEIKETEQKENPLTKAKVWSLIGKVVGLTVLLGGSLLIGIGKLTNLTVDDLLKLSVGCVVLFATVDINILADKFFK